MNTGDIFRLLAGRCKDTFLGVFPCDRLPAKLPARRPLLLVCNTEPHDKSGEHWIALCLTGDGHGEYFDSYGLPPKTMFKRFLEENCRKFVWNEMRLQSLITAFCGHYCVFYCLFRNLDYSLNSILKCFSDDTTVNDLFVHKFVCNNL